MHYVDGFVTPVPLANRAAYQALAEKAAEFFKAVGALSVVECWQDEVPNGEHTSFPMAVKKLETEAVVFSWIVWPSKEVRDHGHAKMMNNPEMPKPEDLPFDGKRLIYGGFQMIVNS